MTERSLDSTDVVLELLKDNPEITALRFVTYKQKPVRPDINKLEELQEEIFRHSHDSHESISTVSRDVLDRDRILHLCSGLASQERFALMSGVQIKSGAPMFIPMIDFMCEKSEANLQLIASQLAHLHRIDGFKLGGGFVLETDKSYHYQARLLLPLDKWSRFVGHVLLLHPPEEHRDVAARTGAGSVVDVRYVGHCLIQGADGNALRISPNLDGGFPKVVKKIDA